MKGRIKTDTDQTKDIKHNKHFLLGDNCILIELLILRKKTKKVRQIKILFFFYLLNHKSFTSQPRTEGVILFFFFFLRCLQMKTQQPSIQQQKTSQRSLLHIGYIEVFITHYRYDIYHQHFSSDIPTEVMENQQLVLYFTPMYMCELTAPLTSGYRDIILLSPNHLQHC